MCNLYSMTKPVDEMRQLFQVSHHLDRLGNFEPLGAIFPKHQAPVMRLNANNERELVQMEWGFSTPKLSKRTGKPITPYAWNNARDDKVERNRLWAESFQTRRCIIPASSFQESIGHNPATNVWFALKGNDEKERKLFAFAGLWRHEQIEMNTSARDRDTHTIITTSPNDLVKPIHPTRMPVILSPDDFDIWLNGSVDEAQKLLMPYSSKGMHIVRRGKGLWSDPIQGS